MQKKIMKLTLVKRSKNQKNQHIRIAESYKNKRILKTNKSKNRSIPVWETLCTHLSHTIITESKPCHVTYAEMLTYHKDFLDIPIDNKFISSLHFRLERIYLLIIKICLNSYTARD